MKAFWLLFSLINLLLLILFLKSGFASGGYETRNIQGWEVKINRQLWVEEKEAMQSAVANAARKHRFTRYQAK